MILIIGGTHECREIVSLLSSLKDEKILNEDYVLSVATQLGYDTYKDVTDNIICGRLNYDDMETFIKEKKVSIIIDASHPHAAAVSDTATAVAGDLDISYIRYVRESISFDPTELNICDDFDMAFSMAKKNNEKKIFLTGSKQIHTALKYFNADEVVVRVVSNLESLKICETLGIPSENIIAMKGPFSKEMNMVTFKDFDVSAAIFKDSGKGSGIIEKIEATKETNIEAYIVKPKLRNVNSSSDIESLKKWVLSK